jgi:hypothetical protein
MFDHVFDTGALNLVDLHNNIPSDVHLTSQVKNPLLKICYTNADCLNNKTAELMALAESENFQAICISETLPKNIACRESYTNFEMIGYNSFHSNTGRGVSIYVRDDFRVERLSVNTSYEDNIWIELSVPNRRNLIIGCIYRSPNSCENNNKALLKLLEEVSNMRCKDTIIVGDFNYKEINWVNKSVQGRVDHPAATFFDTVNDLFLTQMITEPTRYRVGETENVLDLVLTNSEDLIDEIRLRPPLGERGDHCVISFCVDLNIDVIRYGENFNFYKGNYDIMREEIGKVDWESELANKSPNEAWVKFFTTISHLINKFVPKRSGKVRKSQPWVNIEVKNAIRNKNKAWKAFKKCKSDQKWEEFKKIRNETNRLVNDSKVNFEQKIAQEIKTNPKQFWNYVRSKKRKKSRFPKYGC